MSIKEASNRWRTYDYQDDDLGQVGLDSFELAHAYIAEHPLDEDEPVTEEWVRSIAPYYWIAGKECSWPGSDLRFAERLPSNPGGFYIWNEVGSLSRSFPSYMTLKTRGQVYLLLRALGIKLK